MVISCEVYQIDIVVSDWYEIGFKLNK